MYYLTYRSQSLPELDNAPVRDQLTKIIHSGTFPHAFLFTGPKGTGKTSAARIIAKILNASENAKGKITTLAPSEDDDNVRAITQGVSPDVIEMDAASHRKIDDIRTLISELKFAPLVSKYKIYIIDEVHMLTKEAFNALLKSLEEPPPSTIFILATTEADALPKTITSRCVVVHFNRAQKADVIHMLQRISKKETLSFSDDILGYIADRADGSFRDAAKLLEMAAIHQVTSVEQFQGLLGQSSDSDDFVEILSAGTVEKALQWISDTASRGGNMRLVIETALENLHNTLMQKNGIDVERKTTYTISVKECAILMSLLQRAYNELKFAPIPAIPLELVVIDFFASRQATP